MNEIHAWGLKIYRPACQRDLKRYLRETGVRVSDIGASDENKPASADVGEEVSCNMQYYVLQAVNILRVIKIVIITICSNFKEESWSYMIEAYVQGKS